MNIESVLYGVAMASLVWGLLFWRQETRLNRKKKAMLKEVRALQSQFMKRPRD